MAPETSSLVVALLATETWDEALVDVIASLGVIEELKSWWTGALSPKWSLDAIITAAAIVQCTVILVFGNARVSKLVLYSFYIYYFVAC